MKNDIILLLLDVMVRVLDILSASANLIERFFG